MKRLFEKLVLDGATASKQQRKIVGTEKHAPPSNANFKTYRTLWFLVSLVAGISLRLSILYHLFIGPDGVLYCLRTIFLIDIIL